MATPSNKERLPRWFYALAVVVVLLCACWSVYVGFPAAHDPQAANQWGESFGGLNTLFSGLAFVLLIATLLLQSEELRLQRGELKMTREQLERAADAQSASQMELARSAEAQLAAQQLMKHQADLLAQSVEIASRTREQLERTAQAQEASGKALSTQATLFNLSVRATVRAAIAKANADYQHLPTGKGDAGRTDLNDDIQALHALLRELESQH